MEKIAEKGLQRLLSVVSEKWNTLPEEHLSEPPPSKCNDCIREGYNDTIFAPPIYDACCCCGHVCTDPGCCKGITGWEDEYLHLYKSYLSFQSSQWFLDHPVSMDLFLKFIKEAWHAGVRKIPIEMVWRRVWWQLRVDNHHGEEIALPDTNTQRFLARLAVEYNPEWADLFRSKELDRFPAHAWER